MEDTYKVKNMLEKMDNQIILGSRAQAAIGSALIKMYTDLTNSDLPHEMINLLSKLEKSEEDQFNFLKQ